MNLEVGSEEYGLRSQWKMDDDPACVPELVVQMYCCMAVNCSKTYNSKSNLKRHVESCHWGIRPYECEVCHQCFSSRQNCLEHSDLHYGKKPYVCQVCGERFRQASRFSLHKRLHLDEFDTEIAGETCKRKHTRSSEE